MEMCYRLFTFFKKEKEKYLHATPPSGNTGELRVIILEIAKECWSVYNASKGKINKRKTKNR